MRFSKTILAAGALLLTGSMGVLADGHSNQWPRMYSYAGVENFCPPGLQPVTMSGEICCGKPNQSHTYQQVKAHPVAKKKHVRHVRAVSSSVDCPIGTKGCTYD